MVSTRQTNLHPVLGAIAVVIKDQKALLVRRKKEPDAGKWGFAGGHVERGETALAAAARELLEETGVKATPQRYLTNLDIITYDGQGQIAYHFLLAVVLCHYESGTPVACDDVSDAAWVKISQIDQYKTSANVMDMINLATT